MDQRIQNESDLVPTLSPTKLRVISALQAESGKSRADIAEEVGREYETVKHAVASLLRQRYLYEASGKLYVAIWRPTIDVRV